MGAVPQCYGWLELSPTHLYATLSMIRQTRESGVLKEGQKAVSVSPLFEDGSFASALVLQYLPNTVPLYVDATHGRAELATRALASVHGAYVRHGDLSVNGNNVLLVRGGGGVAERVVIIDFDVAETPRLEEDLRRPQMLIELRDLWVNLYQCLVGCAVLWWVGSTS